MKINKIILALAALLIPSFISAAPVRSKEIYSSFIKPENRYRPFVRWWWNGDRVEAGELIRELRLLKAAGIGGVEINPIAFPNGADTLGTKALTWLSDEWISMVDTVFAEASSLGMYCDLIIGSGWPFGSESLPRKERASVVLTYAVPVKKGEPFEMSMFNIFKALDPGVTVSNPGRNPKLLSAFLVPDPISDIGEAEDVTGLFADGVLNVDASGSDRHFYAMVLYDSFASVINGAPGASGSILNHMDKAAVQGYLDRMYSAIEPKTGPLSKRLRAFFVDSMELEGCNWTGDFAAEFLRRRGYDPMPWLPFTMFKVGRLGDAESFDYGAKKGAGFQDLVNRARFDFELTKAELLHERYTETFLEWCKSKGVKSRAQAYGRGFFPLETSLGYDIPEGESWTTNWLRHRLGEEMGDEDYRRGRGYTMINKYVSSAAHLKGKRLVSAEEMTNTYLVFNTSLEMLKVGSDMSAASGISHSVWHGFNYSPPEAAFPGWVQYGSYYNEKNPWWPYFKYLNDYRARMSAVLQNADMHTDIAILPPNYDMWTEIGVQTEPFPVRLNIPYTSLIWEAVHKNGGGADYVSEIILKDAVVKDGKLCYGPKKYGNLFLVELSGITREAMEKISEFVLGGGRVFCIGKFPEKSLGLKDSGLRDIKIKELVEHLKPYRNNFILLDKPSDGKYLEWYGELIEKYSLPRSLVISKPDRFLLQNRYVADDGSDIFLFANAHMSEAKRTEIIFPKSITSGRKAWLYNPADGKRYSLPLKDGRIDFEFGPSETYFFVFNRLGGRAETWRPLPVSGKDSFEVSGWNLSLFHSQEDWVKEIPMPELKDLKDTEFVNFMGELTYKASIKLDGKSLPKYMNLGAVHEICELKINGINAGVRWFGRRIYDVSSLVHDGENTVEVKVIPLMGNYMHTLKENKAARRFVIKRNQPLKSMGLLGPVKLYQ